MLLVQTIKVFGKQCKSNIRLTILTGVCLVSSFLALIFLLERGYSLYVVDADTERETRVLYLTSSAETRIQEIYDKIAGDPVLPQLAKATVSGDVYSGVYWDTEGEEPYYVPYGRFSSGEEIASGAKVALLGTGYLPSFSCEEIDSIWASGIKINAAAFAAIGTYNYNWGDFSDNPYIFRSMALPNAVTIPIDAFFACGLKATRMRCVFAEELSVAQYSYLAEFLEPYKDLQEIVLPKTEKMNRTNMQRRMAAKIAPFAAIVFLAVMNIANIVLYWLRREFARLQIYRICGASNAAAALMISVQVLLFVCVGFGCACGAQGLLRMLMPEGFASRAPVFFYLAILLGHSIAMLAIVLMESMRFLGTKNLAYFRV